LTLSLYGRLPRLGNGEQTVEAELAWYLEPVPGVWDRPPVPGTAYLEPGTGTGAGDLGDRDGGS